MASEDARLHQICQSNHRESDEGVSLQLGGDAIAEIAGNYSDLRERKHCTTIDHASHSLTSLPAQLGRTVEPAVIIYFIELISRLRTRSDVVVQRKLLQQARNRETSKSGCTNWLLDEMDACSQNQALKLSAESPMPRNVLRQTPLEGSKSTDLDKTTAAKDASRLFHHSRFKEKVQCLQQTLECAKLHYLGGLKDCIIVRRSHLLEDTLQEVGERLEFDGLYPGAIAFQFAGELAEGDGPLREWVTEFFKLARVTCSDVNSNIYPVYGAMMGLAVHWGINVPCDLPRAAFAHILGLPYTLDDIEDLDFQLSCSLRFILDNHVEPLGLYFSLSSPPVNLIENGDCVRVTEANKTVYIHEVLNHEMLNFTAAFTDIASSFLHLIPSELLLNLTPSDLQLIISGENEIDVEDWRANTGYQGRFENLALLNWFWNYVEKGDRQRILEFWTGYSRMPFGGFESTKARFLISSGSRDRLPSARACFNQLILPPYASYEELERSMNYALEESQTFEFL